MSPFAWLRSPLTAARVSDTPEATQQQNLKRVVMALAAGLVAGLLVVLWDTGRHCPVAWAWAFACTMTGAAVGFLFGIPREIQGDGGTAPTTDAAANSRPTTASRTGAYEQRVNTNLEQVSDWLTKIIVGLGLVELKDVPKHLESVTAFLARGSAESDCIAFSECPAFGGAVTVYFAVLGFFGGYLLTRLFLAPAFGALEEAARAKQEAKRATGANLLLRQGVDPGNIQREFIFEDAQKGRWGGLNEANGRSLSANVTPSSISPDWFRIELAVASTDSQSPLTGQVTFHLPPSFQPPNRQVPVADQKASLEVFAYRPFTVGAEADQGRIRLELDLATLSNPPPGFR